MRENKGMKMKTLYKAEFAVGGFLVRGQSCGRRVSSTFVADATTAAQHEARAINELLARETTKERLAIS